jgi:hypothetical protein
MRRFVLDRKEDVTGISGTGIIAEGVEFTNGQVALKWLGPHPSVVLWPDITHVVAVHGHDGLTELVWID